MQKYTNKLKKWIGSSFDLEHNGRFAEKLNTILAEESSERKHLIIIEMAKREDLLGAHEQSGAFFEEYMQGNKQ